jgi:anti-sigma factor ChrR (cupin superfamily)
MTFKRTQIYLDPDDHRRLAAEARRRGMSMTALLREIVHRSVAPSSTTDGDGFEAVIGLIDTEEPTDIAKDAHDYAAAVLNARYDKKMGELADSRSRRGRAKP